METPLILIVATVGIACAYWAVAVLRRQPPASKQTPNPFPHGRQLSIWEDGDAT
jgi:hypothetical protein